MKKKLLFLLNYYLPILVWALVIFKFSNGSVPSASEVVWQDFLVKKIAHIIVYAVFALLIYRALLKSGVSWKMSVFYAILASFLYGLTDEYHQSFVPGREPKIRDAMIDAFGACIAMLVVRQLLPKLSGKLKMFFKKVELI